jgi:hypothetical protein
MVKKYAKGLRFDMGEKTEEIFGMTVAVNVALFASYEDEEKYSKMCDYIETTIINSPLIKNIGTFGRQLPYEETAFAGFDEFLYTGKLRKTNK